MDDHQLDRSFEQRVGQYVDPGFDEDNWNKLSGRLDMLSPAGGWGIKHILLWSLVSFSLLTNALLAGIILQKQHNIESLLDQMARPESGDEKNLTDTIYIFQTDTIHSFISHQLPGAGLSAEVSASGTVAAGSSAPAEKAGAAPAEKAGATAPKAGASFEGVFPILLPRAYLLQAGRQVQVPLAVSALPELVDGGDAPGAPVPARSWFKKIDFSAGVQASLPMVSLDLGQSQANSLQAGLKVEAGISPRLRLSLGANWMPLSYKIDDHESRINFLIDDYPGLGDNLEHIQLHEIYMETQAVELPVTAKYFFAIQPKYAFFGEMGIYARGMFRQDFTYEFDQRGTYFYQEESLRQKRFSLGGYRAGIGLEYILTPRLMSQFTLFIQHDVRPQGIEGRHYTIWGLQTAILFKNKKP